MTFNRKTYAPIHGVELKAALGGKQLKYEIEDGLGHGRIPFHGPENFGLGGEYSFKAHRGWIERGEYLVKGGYFCVKVPRYDPRCRQLFQAKDGQFLVLEDSPWPVQLLDATEATIEPPEPDVTIDL